MKFIKLSKIIINTSKINKIIIEPNKYNIYLHDGYSFSHIIIAGSGGGGGGEEKQTIMDICSKKNPEDYKIIEKWILEINN